MHVERGHCLTHCNTCKKFDVLNRPMKSRKGKTFSLRHFIYRPSNQENLTIQLDQVSRARNL